MIDRSTVAMRTAPGSSLQDCSVCFSLSLIANMRTFRENRIFATANRSFARLSSLYKTIVAIIDFPSCIPAIAPFFLIFFFTFPIPQSPEIWRVFRRRLGPLDGVCDPCALFRCYWFRFSLLGPAPQTAPANTTLPS